MPVLSVITVVKDDPIGLRRTLESIRGQRHSQSYSQSREVVVVDGSNPTLETDVLSVGISGLRYFTQDPAGIYAAMNFGVSKAQGEYLLFLNAGDTLADSQVLESLIEQLERESPQWAFGRVHFTSENGRELTERDWDYDTEAKHLFARGVFPSHQGTVMRRDLVSQLGGFDQSFAIASDYQLMLRAHVKAKPLTLDFVIADFRQGGASTVYWRVAAREFHRARTQVFRPRGLARVREWSDTGVQYMKLGISHALSGLRHG